MRSIYAPIGKTGKLKQKIHDPRIKATIIIQSYAKPYITKQFHLKSKRNDSALLIQSYVKPYIVKQKKPSVKNNDKTALKRALDEYDRLNDLAKKNNNITPTDSLKNKKTDRNNPYLNRPDPPPNYLIEEGFDAEAIDLDDISHISDKSPPFSPLGYKEKNTFFNCFETAFYCLIQPFKLGTISN